MGTAQNFITGNNGSGKSAILTALCVAFGIKAQGTQQASSLKYFISNVAMVLCQLTLRMKERMLSSFSCTVEC